MRTRWFVVLLPLLAVLAACGSAWPAACRDTLSGVRCSCDRFSVVLLPRDGHPDGARVLLNCDGQPLAVTVEADRVGKPQ
jgi:hypothetical protein